MALRVHPTRMIQSTRTSLPLILARLQSIDKKTTNLERILANK